MTADGKRTDAIRSVMDATSFVDVFGHRGDEVWAESVRKKYRQWARLMHPDLPGGSEEAFKALTDFYEMALKPAPKIVLSSGLHNYTVGDKLVGGDLADIYRATYDDGRNECLVKFYRSPKNGDLGAAEAKSLIKLRDKGSRRHQLFVSELIDSFRQRDEHSVDRHVNVLKPLPGFYTLTEVAKTYYPRGVAPEDVAWIFKRVLVALGFAADNGIVHGAVTPDHIMIHPEMHGLVLVDWSYSVETDHPIRAIVPKWREFYPAEVFAKKNVNAGLDTYMATWCMREIAMTRLPGAFRAFLRGTALNSVNGRPDDPWVLLKEFDDLLYEMYGPRKFHPFSMPTEARL
jgi:serine/threonine protein kinase